MSIKADSSLLEACRNRLVHGERIVLGKRYSILRREDNEKSRDNQRIKRTWYMEYKFKRQFLPIMGITNHKKRTTMLIEIIQTFGAILGICAFVGVIILKLR